MKNICLTVCLVVVSCFFANAQSYTQYFDGADTSVENSILVRLDTASSNIWQIGAPHKVLFDTAATVPNVLVTDTVNDYPTNNVSRFTFTIVPWTSWGLLAIQWKQKLDMDPHRDGGVIEYSIDTGGTWQNVFNDPHVFNFYGFLPTNRDTLPNGDFAFSGTDTAWQDVWLCFDMSWLSLNDSITFRYTFESDSVDNHKEGWMIDNLMAHVSLMHPVKEVDKKDYMNVYPNPTKGIVNVEFQKIHDFHIIEKMEFLSADGTVLRQWTNIPTKFWFDTSKYADGLYFLKVKTNIKSETIPIVVKKD